MAVMLQRCIRKQFHCSHNVHTSVSPGDAIRTTHENNHLCQLPTLSQPTFLVPQGTHDLGTRGRVGLVILPVDDMTAIKGYYSDNNRIYAYNNNTRNKVLAARY